MPLFLEQWHTIFISKGSHGPPACQIGSTIAPVQPFIVLDHFSKGPVLFTLFQI